jgi:hypothetical protein
VPGLSRSAPASALDISGHIANPIDEATMKPSVVRPLAAVPLAVAVFLAGSSPARVEAQFGVGMYPGYPFLVIAPEFVPSPNDYLFEHDLARISGLANGARQQAGASQMGSAMTNPNAYFHRIRDFSGDDTYDVRSRQSLSQRAYPVRSQAPPGPKPAAVAEAPRQFPLDAFFLSDGALDWPSDAPNSVGASSTREDVSAALKAVREEMRSAGKAKAQSVGGAKWKLVNYGQKALADVRATRSKVVGEVFHDFLLFLHQALDRAANTDG